jgi:translocation and assembly module TamA
MQRTKELATMSLSEDRRVLLTRYLITVSFVGALAACSTTPADPAKSNAQPITVLGLEVEAPGPLDSLLRDNLDLGQVNRLAAGDPLPPGELERLLAAAPAQARSLVETEGYFNARIEVENLGGTPPRVQMRVQPGPRTVIRDVKIEATGPIATPSEPDAPFAREADAALRKDWPLPPGAPYRASEWSRAKTGSLAQLRAHGYVAADWTTTLARVDAAVQRADLSASVQSGPLYRTGPLRIEGLKAQDAETLRNIADFPPGTPATESLLLDFQERLQKTGLYNRATAVLEPDPEHPEATPVRVQLTERQLQEATVGVGIGANVGALGSLDYVHRRPFGLALVARNKFEVSKVEQRFQGELSTQTLPGLYRNLVAGDLDRVVSATDTVSSLSARVGRAQDTKLISRIAFVEAERSTTTSDQGRTRSDAVAAHYQSVWRHVDDPLSPTLGNVWTAQVALGGARSNPGSQGPFLRLYGKLDTFKPVGSWFLQGRIELGQVLSRADVMVPDLLRFRAGGDGSVRGYSYRSLTPQVNGVDTGGKVLFTASAEAAHQIVDSMPLLLGAVFIDAGRSATRWSDLKPAVGYGVGLRYRSPVGPVKLDIAYGEEVKRLRLHLTVGVTF